MWFPQIRKDHFEKGKLEHGWSGTTCIPIREFNITPELTNIQTFILALLWSNLILLFLKEIQVHLEKSTSAEHGIVLLEMGEISVSNPDAPQIRAKPNGKK